MTYYYNLAEQILELLEESKKYMTEYANKKIADITSKKDDYLRSPAKKIYELFLLYVDRLNQKDVSERLEDLMQYKHLFKGKAYICLMLLYVFVEEPPNQLELIKDILSYSVGKNNFITSLCCFRLLLEIAFSGPLHDTEVYTEILVRSAELSGNYPLLVLSDYFKAGIYLVRQNYQYAEYIFEQLRWYLKHELRTREINTLFIEKTEFALALTLLINEKYEKCIEVCKQVINTQGDVDCWAIYEMAKYKQGDTTKEQKTDGPKSEIHDFAIKVANKEPLEENEFLKLIAKYKKQEIKCMLIREIYLNNLRYFNKYSEIGRIAEEIHRMYKENSL